MSGVNILVVEDEDQWHSLYRRAAGAHGLGDAVKIAKDLATAEQLIEAAKFAVAFVDIGLDISDDRNVDGLRVMEKIRAAGDETSIVVVTGRSGQDALSIARDAMKKYDAYDAVGKSSVKPSDIRRLLEEGLEAYRKAAVVGRRAARDALLGAESAMVIDDQVMRATQFRGDVGAFYDFLAELFDQYLPVVPRDDAVRAHIEREMCRVYGEYWSRATGVAVAVCFGARGSLDQAIQADGADSRLVGKYKVGAPMRRLAGHGIEGAVFELAECRREDFGTRSAESRHLRS
jgi:CheY-like chemotaxis protein